MSEQGWRDFLAAEGVDDWVVLHGGATAVFRVGSLSEAAHLAAAVADTPGLDGRGVLLTIADDRLTVRLSRDIWQLEPEYIQFARMVSAVARDHGAIANRAAVQEVQLAIAAKSDAIDAGFWRAVLGYAAVAEDNAVDPSGHGSTVWMQEIDQAKSLRHAMHIDVSVAREHVRRGLRQRWQPAAVSWMGPMRRRTGPCRTVQVTASVSAPGRTGPLRLHSLEILNAALSQVTLRVQDDANPRVHRATGVYARSGTWTDLTDRFRMADYPDGIACRGLC